MSIAVMQREPALAETGLTGSAVYYDARTDDARLTIANALAAEVQSMSMPTTVFSRSSESHNQDKVSLGLSAGVACAQTQLERNAA